jgi:hypothetical protein
MPSATAVKPAAPAVASTVRRETCCAMTGPPFEMTNVILSTELAELTVRSKRHRVKTCARNGGAALLFASVDVDVAAVGVRSPVRF